jgi:hypothetical protein
MLVAALGCSADATSEPIMGSGKVIESATSADVVEKVSISLPFRAQVFNGEKKELLLRGEDNLLARIAVEETAAGDWTISAPEDLAFEQHVDMQIAIPYVGMVMLALDGDDLQLMERPEAFWNDAPQAP